MLDKSAIQELSKAQAIEAASNAIHAADDNFVALTSDFQLHDLEKYMVTRRRARGTMTTSSVVDFSAYVLKHKEEGATVFINQDAMTAVAVLNLGDAACPGHADNRATLTAKKTAAYVALLNIATGAPLKQSMVAEFMEDWASAITQCTNGDATIPLTQAIAAIRKITIESMRKMESAEQQLSASRSAFENVQATSGGDPLPAKIDFDWIPYHGLEARTFSLRLAVVTSGDKPAITLRIVNKEEHDEGMAQELADLVREALQGSLPTLIGSYAAGA